MIDLSPTAGWPWLILMLVAIVVLIVLFAEPLGDRFFEDDR